MKKNHLISAALIFLASVCTAGCGVRTLPEDGTPETAATEFSEAGSGETESGGTESGREKETARETEGYAVGSLKDDYLLPDAQTHAYTQEELSSLSREELRIARNEIYARHGRKFKSDDLKLYFSSKSWYHPTVEPADFDDAVLNQAETGSLAAIKEAEEKAASEMISCPKIGREEFPKIDGSTATIPLSQAIYRLATGASQSEAESFIRHDKTTQAYLNLIWDQGPDLVIAYEPGDSVKKCLEEAGDKDSLIIRPIGRDALVFMANRENPVKSLTRKQVVDIYNGRITNWKALGGSGQDIRAFQRPGDSGSQNLMEKLVMKGTAMADAPQDYVVSEMGELIEKVSSYDNTGEALGYSVYFYAKNMYQKPELKFMAIDGVMPSADTIRDGSYPYVNDFYAAVRKDEPKDSNAFRLFEWLTSDDGQALINGLGYVGIRDEKKSLPEGFYGEKEVFNGSIPLKQGESLLADGDYLYGENGIAVFDKSVHLVKFIRHIESQEISPFTVWDGGGLLIMQDSLTGKYGVYSITEEQWVCRPVYDNAFRTKEGVGLEHVTWEGSEGSGKWKYSCDYTDWEGNYLKKDVKSDEMMWGDDEDATPYYDEQEFIEHYPKIQSELGVTVDDVSVYSTEFQENIAMIRKNRVVYFYDMRGKCLFKFNEEEMKTEKSSILTPYIVDAHMAYLSVSAPKDWDRGSYYIYRDGALVKKLTFDAASGRISDIGELFYIRNVGNYLYIYNYQDQACAKFLDGYYTND